MKKVLIFLIRIYQKTLSPDHGPLKKLHPHGFCRFYPTCSEYSLKSIEKHGAILGSFIGFWRINRCNPWSKGGVDKPEDAKLIQALYGLIILLIYIAISFMLFLVFKTLVKGA